MEGALSAPTPFVLVPAIPSSSPARLIAVEPAIARLIRVGRNIPWSCVGPVGGIQRRAVVARRGMDLLAQSGREAPGVPSQAESVSPIARTAADLSPYISISRLALHMGIR